MHQRERLTLEIILKTASLFVCTYVIAKFSDFRGRLSVIFEFASFSALGDLKSFVEYKVILEYIQGYLC